MLLKSSRETTMQNIRPVKIPPNIPGSSIKSMLDFDNAKPAWGSRDFKLKIILGTILVRITNKKTTPVDNGITVLMISRFHYAEKVNHDVYFVNRLRNIFAPPFSLFNTRRVQTGEHKLYTNAFS